MFITGVKDDCDNNYNEYSLENGDNLLERDYRCHTEEETMKYMEKVAKERNTYIDRQSMACSKFGKIITMNDIIWDSFEHGM